jgi:peptidoglycan hydrolase CwlO-like protein
MTPLNSLPNTGVLVSPSPSSPYIISQYHPSQHSHSPYASNGSTNASEVTTATTALDLSRIACHAGFLHKLGETIPEYKRRFFVLHSTTRLFYFLSPHDIHPRGCIELDGSARMEPVEQLPDGRHRFAISWQGQEEEDRGSLEHQRPRRRRRIILEARSQEVGEQWLERLDVERVSTLKQKVESLSEENMVSQARIKELTRQVDDFKMVEQDRDGALDDARRWKAQFERLDEAIRLLTQQLRRPPPTTKASMTIAAKENSNVGDKEDAPRHSDKEIDNYHLHNDNGDDGVPGEEKKDASCDEPKARMTTTLNQEQIQQGQDQRKNSSLLDTTLEEDIAGYSSNAVTVPDQDIGDLFHVPGTYFAALSNACQQQRQSLRLAATEATKAVEDLQASQAKLTALERRMQKAEKHLCKLWEENCAIRKTMKQKKREKRVLVREVKALQHQVAVEQQEQEERERQLVEQEHLWQRATRMELRLQQQANLMNAASTAPPTSLSSAQAGLPSMGQEDLRVEVDEDEALDTSMIGSEDERLLTELEEHVASTIRLHERFLAASGEPLLLPQQSHEEPHRHGWSFKGGDQYNVLNTSLDSYASEDGHLLDTSMESSDVTSGTTVARHNFSRSGATLKIQQQQPQQQRLPAFHDKGAGRLSPLQPKLLSLFDDDEGDDESNDDETSARVSEHLEEDAQSLAPSVATSLSAICSVSVEVGDSTDEEDNSVYSGSHPRPPSAGSGFTKSNRDRKNPLLVLDEAEGEDISNDIMEPVNAVQFNITTNGQATSRLVCPMADVIQSSTEDKTMALSAPLQDSNDGLRVYHVTFYTQKIGIQFQKAPPPPTRSKGLLTDAMTADLAGNVRDDGKTASELRRVAAISEWSKSAGSRQHKDDTKKGQAEPLQQDMYCPVVTATDVVLVCGFEGFEDTGSNIRPKLGARLVAFDGISVEIGNWTFHSIRKSIKARGRPLTLSFRNDFLTSEQRAVLTKAVADVAKAIVPPPRPQHVSQYRSNAPIAVHARRPSTTPSLNSAVSTESDYFVNDRGGGGSQMDRFIQQQQDDDETPSSASGIWPSRREETMSSNNSVSTRQGSTRSRWETSSVASDSVRSFRQADFYSFSEAGTSSVISAAFAPLMANLLNGMSVRTSAREKSTPQYLERQESLENTPQHRDFQSNLL